MYDTIIIGAGLSGLAAGIRLAYYEQWVCILERHYTIGGLNSFYRLRGRDYDVGLHAVTNYATKGTKKGPLVRLLRQLRLSWEDFSLAPQLGSLIAFPGVQLAFNNEIGLLESEIGRAFPGQRDNFKRLLGQIVDYDDLNQEIFEWSARDDDLRFIVAGLDHRRAVAAALSRGRVAQHADELAGVDDAGHLAREHEEHLVVIGARVVLAVESAAPPAPIGPGAGETVEHLLRRGLRTHALFLGQ